MVAAVIEAPGRNELCPCGSGKKYKHCHLEKGAPTPLGWRVAWVILAVVVVGSAAGWLLGIADGDLTAGESAERVWSEEHGHWHEVNKGKPPGPAPPGKVWNEEHGHWHDAAPSGEPAASVSVDPSAVPLLDKAPVPVAMDE